MTTRVYKYGCKAPSINRDKAIEQLRLGNKAWNAFAKLKCEHTEQYRRLRAEQYPELTALEVEYANTDAEINRIEAEVKISRVAARSKRVPAPPELKTLTAKKKELGARIKVLKKECVFDSSEHNAKCAVERKALAAEMQNEWKLYWATKNCIAEQVFKTKHLHYRPYNGSGRLVVQDAGSLRPTWEQLLAGRWKDIVFDVTERNGKLRGHVSIIISRHDRKHPVYVTCPIVIHRSPPANAIVKGADLICEATPSGYEWSLHVTLTGEFVKPHGEGTVAIDVGWRETESGLKALTWVGEGEQGVEYMPKRIADGFDHVDRLASIRARNFNEIIAHIRSCEKPDWLREATSHAHAWKKPSRIARLVANWQDGCEGLRERLVAWLKQDAHNRAHQEGLRRKMVRCRKDWARNVAARLRQRYGFVLLDSIQIAKLKEKGPVENPSDMSSTSRRNAAMAAPSELIKLLEDMPHVKVPVAYTSMTCHECGRIEKNSGEIITCECGVTIDRDVRACLNMLAASGDVTHGFSTAQDLSQSENKSPAA